MNPLLLLQDALSENGFEVEYRAAAGVDAGIDAGIDTGADESDHLSLPLQQGEQGYSLVLHWIAERGDASGIVSLYLNFDIELEQLDLVPEVMRMVLWLNRFALVGHFGFEEDSGQVYYRYNLVTADLAGDESMEAVVRTLHIARFLALANAPLIEQVVAGEATCQDVLDQLARLGEEGDGPPTLQ